MLKIANNPFSVILFLIYILLNCSCGIDVSREIELKPNSWVIAITEDGQMYHGAQSFETIEEVVQFLDEKRDLNRVVIQYRGAGNDQLIMNLTQKLETKNVTVELSTLKE